MFFKNLSFFSVVSLFLFLIGGFFVVIPQFVLATGSNVVISEIQIDSIDGTGGIEDDWVELYNPTDSTIDLTGWSIQKTSASGGSHYRKKLTDSIPAHGFFLIVRNHSNTSESLKNLADILAAGYSFSLSDNNVLYLVNDNEDIIDGNDPNIVDKVGLGSALDFEGAAIPNPPDGQSVERKPGGENGNGEDTNNNINDFFIQTSPNPENSSSPAQPPFEGEEDTTPPEEITNLTAIPGDTIVDLSWIASINSAGDLAYQILYISSDGGVTYDGGISLEPEITSHQVVDLINDSIYTFKITVRDISGNESIGETIDVILLEIWSTINPGDIVINEFISDPVAEENEWIELYNTTEQVIDLLGWTIEDNTGSTYGSGSGDTTLDGLTIPASSFLVLEKGTDFTFALNNGGDVIILKRGGTVIMDQVAYGSWDDGNIEDNAPFVSDPNSLIRYPDGQDSDIDNVDWQITNTPTKRSNNLLDGEEYKGEEEEEEESAGEEVKFYPGDIIINEFVSDPADGDEEWVELYNNKEVDIDLNDWTLEEGSEAVTNLEGILTANGFIVFEKPKGNLNNKGDIITLKYKGLTIDKVTYGNWDDGQMTDNAPATGDPYSVARISDGWDTNHDFNDFQITTTLTKESANVLTSEEEESEEFGEDFSTDIIINEVFPNPEGKDNENEFIELKNIGEEAVDLDSWKLGDNSSKKYTIDSEDLETTQIQPGEILVFLRSVTSIALNNSGIEKAKLYQPNGNLIDEVEYSGKVQENYSYARAEDGKWFWTAIVTGGEENIIDIPNESPEAVINAPFESIIGQEVVFDASDSVDPEEDELIYFWDLGDGTTSLEISPKHFYQYSGIYQIKLTVNDSAGNQSEAEFIITVLDKTGALIPSDIDVTSWGLIMITEFLPNPEGSDTKEWIEIWNASDYPIDLTDWKIDDGEKGSRGYKIKELIIEPGQYLVFKKSETRIALNNSFDSVRIFNAADELVDQVDYEEAFEGASFCLDGNNQWVWNFTLTPGEKNIVTPLEIEEIQGKSSKKKTKKSERVIETTLEEVRHEDIGDKVRVKGIVSAEPGILGSQIFYLAGSGIQIYMNKKDFPDLKLGDLVEITGILAESGGETRIKIALKEDIVVLEHKEPPESYEVKTGDINEENEGYLVTITGEIIEIRGSSLFIDDGSEEIKVYIKQSTGIKKSNLHEGDIVSVTGIVSQTKSGYRLLPRYPDDIKIEKEASQSAQLGEVVVGSGKSQQMITYLTVTAIALFSVLVGLIAKYKFIKKKE